MFLLTSHLFLNTSALIPNTSALSDNISLLLHPNRKEVVVNIILVTLACNMGTLASGVITFPDKGLLCIMGDDAIYGNENGLTKIVLPNAVPASARKFARANSVKKGFVRTHNTHAAKVNTKVLGHLDNKAVLR